MENAEEKRPKRPKDDHYPTPPEATRALLSVEGFAGGVWEICAGHGVMAREFEAAGNEVAATTLLTSKSPSVVSGVDFLAETALRKPNIATNPPFKIAEKIIRHALSLKPAKAAFFLNVKFLAGQKRARSFYEEFPLARLWVMADRITMYPDDWEGERNSTTETHAWFIWEHPNRRQAWTGGILIAKDFLVEDATS